MNRWFPSLALAAMVFLPGTGQAQMNPPMVSADTISPDSVEVAGEIVVQAADLSSSDLKALKSEYGMHAASAWSDDNDEIEVINVPIDQEEAVLVKLQHDKRVKIAEREHVFHATGWTPNDPLLDKQWGVKRLGSQDAWNYSSGRNVVVAVVDTGVDPKLSDFAGTKVVMGYDFINDKEAGAFDDQGHGSFCASEIASTTNNGVGGVGVAYGATILAVKVLSANGSGSSASVASGIDFAVDQGVQVISMSLGAHSPDRLIELAVNRALSKNITVVAAAGNSGKSVGWPAAYPGVIAVSATDENDKIASFSSRGPELAVAAPGVNIVAQTIDGHGGEKFDSYRGTSMACPFVAATSALLVAEGISGDAVRTAITSTADDKKEPNLYGAGIINAKAAVRSVFWWHFGLRTLALFVLAGLLKRHITKVGGTPIKPGTLGMLVAGTGLLPFLPFTGLLPKLGHLRLLGEVAMRPFADWDIVLLGANFHPWMVLFAAVPTVLLSMLTFGIKAFKSTLGGFAIGSAAYLTTLAWQGDLMTPVGGLMTRVIALASAGLCLWFARMTLDASLDKVSPTSNS